MNKQKCITRFFEGEKWLLVVCNKEEAKVGVFPTKCG